MAEKKFANSNSKSFKDKDQQVEQLRVPPHSLEAEQSVIGGLCLENDTFDRVGEAVVAQDFYSRAHRITFETIGNMIEKGLPVDLVTLTEALENDQRLEDAGGFGYIAEVITGSKR